MVSYLKLILILLLSPAILVSQPGDIKFENLTRVQGLSHSSVLCMLQGSREFIWLGTYDGLNRYDGYKFSIFRNNPKDPSSLSANGIYSIYEDRSGVLWIGTYGGELNKLIPGNNGESPRHFFHYKHDPKHEKI